MHRQVDHFAAAAVALAGVQMATAGHALEGCDCTLPFIPQQDFGVSTIVTARLIMLLACVMVNKDACLLALRKGLLTLTWALSSTP